MIRELTLTFEKRKGNQRSFKTINTLYTLFQTGTFPSKVKTTKVIPLFKTGEKRQFNYYRPFSLLSQFSKILEKTIHKKTG